jgi:predicted CoA-binding protein
MSDGACEMPGKNATTAEVREILAGNRVVAVVGMSENPARASNHVAAYLMEHGYRVIPVNPARESILGQKCWPSLSAVPEKVDIVDIFRKPDAVPEIVDEAIKAGAKVVWMQEGIVHNAAAEKARAAGLKVVMNKCMLKEHRAL